MSLKMFKVLALSAPIVFCSMALNAQNSEQSTPDGCGFNNRFNGFNRLELSAPDGLSLFSVNATTSSTSASSSEFRSSSISLAGDVNDDGFDDIVIGSKVTAASYVVFGNASGFAPCIELASLDGQNGFVINGISRLAFSHSVSSAGDVNGDGIDDVILGAGRTVGDSFVVFGRANGFAPSINVASLDGQNGFAIKGDQPNSVSSAGDVNGDGFDDVIIGSPFSGPDVSSSEPGSSYVVFGAAGGFAPVLELANLDGRNGFSIRGEPGDRSGWSVSSAGDVNSDGIDDVVIGAPGADPNGRGLAGQSYVVFGRAGSFAPSFDLAAVDGRNGFVILGARAGDRSGLGVSSAGDFNGDGIDDVIVFSPQAVPSVATNMLGESYVLFGSTSGFATSLDLASLDSRNGRVIQSLTSLGRLASSVSTAGDIDGDGFDDVILGLGNADHKLKGFLVAGRSHVVHGSNDSGYPRREFVVAANMDPNIFASQGVDRFIFKRGSSTTEAMGTINNISVDDVIDFSALGFSPDQLELRLVGDGSLLKLIEGFGANEFQLTVELNDLTVDEVLSLIDYGDSSANNNTVLGTSADDILFGTDDNDVIDGRGGSDRVWESAGDDSVTLSGSTGQMNYQGVSSDYTFTSNSDGSVSVTKPEGGVDTLNGVTGVWFNEERAWFAINRLVDQNPEPPTPPVPPTGGENRIVASAAQETLRGTAANDTFVFAAGTSTGQALDTLTGWAAGDTIDLSGLGVSATDIETRIVAGGTVLKLIEDFGATDFQLKINLGRNNSQQVIDSITFQEGTNQGGTNSGGSVINATAEADILIATDATDSFVFGAGSSSSSSIDEIRGIAADDSIDLSALGLSPDDLEYRTVGNGTVLKIIEGFGANDFQLRVVLNGLTQDQIIALVKLDSDSSGSGNSGSGNTGTVITATASEETFTATDETETFVFTNGTSVSGALDTIIGLSTSDRIDLSALGLSADQVEFRVVGGGSVLKIIDGFAANDFQLKVNLGNLSVAQVMSLIDWGGAETTRVLLFSETRDFRHESTEVALAALEELAASAGFETDRANDSAGVFTETNLANYDAVVWVLTSGDVLNASEQASFEQYIRSGGGYAGIHAASFTEYEWPWYGDLVGAYFEAHPVIQSATQLVEDTTHASTAHLDATWTRTDEWYDYRSNPRGQVNVLLSLDESSYTGGLMGDDHPSAWYHEYDGGRSWYTGGGHTAASYSEPDFRAHLLGGLRYATGRN